MRMRQAELLVERVVLYRTLTGEPVQQAVAHYQPVGRFLVKLIDSRPDFDHIVLLERALAAPVAVPKHGVDENLAELAQRARMPARCITRRPICAEFARRNVDTHAGRM
jgi:hypothetical protein